MDIPYKITITGADNEAELTRTLATLFSTREGSQPADRSFGISWDCLDDVLDVAESLFYLEAVKKVEKYEPRVEVSDITFEHWEGGLAPHIFFIAKGEDG